MYFSLLSRALYVPSRVKLDCCIRHQYCVHFRWTTPLQLVTCFYKISFCTRAALTVILDVPGHPVRATIFDLPATFSDILHTRYAVSLHRDRLTVNSGKGNLTAIESEWPCELLRGTKFSVPLPSQIDLSREHSVTHSYAVCCILPYYE
jgi:hypothetical protein